MELFKLWKRVFEEYEANYKKECERLKSVFLVFHERVEKVIQTIPVDLVGYTVHDIDHINALWEMADLLIGEEYKLNPAELFVLGGAILLHDAALTASAYTGGIEEIRDTTEYNDAYLQYKESFGSNLTDSKDCEEIAHRIAISEALRMNHARKAAEMATQEWTSPINEDKEYLIIDEELRHQYGFIIGQIASSHHWDINEINLQFSTTLGAFSKFPGEWNVNPVKIALILRCSDAMQIDDRRAPHFSAALRSIPNRSLIHWKFQNKLSKPQIKDNELIYTSKSPFTINEAEAWNLCFDTIQMIDHELRDSNDLLLSKDLPQFEARAVAGAGKAEVLAKYIQVEGWRPLPLNLKVSSVPHLAKTLGGSDLYNNPLTPLRELIQNAADAIEARTFVDKDYCLEDGIIIVDYTENDSEVYLDVSDNGVGMSEHVLTNALLDFGFSFWKSSQARKEFPGIQNNAGKFRGRYGIGFFSIFMWTSKVYVFSKRYNEAIEETKVLEFRHGLETSPILRVALKEETSSKWNSKIRLVLKRGFEDHIFPKYEEKHLYKQLHYRMGIFVGDFHIKQTWIERLKLLCGALSITVQFNKNGIKEQISLPQWKNCEISDFFRFFSGVAFEKTEENERFISSLSSLTDSISNGGRCFLNPYKKMPGGVAVYEKGIFVGREPIEGIYGVIESEALNAARDRFKRFDFSSDQEWINESSKKAFKECRNIGEKLSIQEILLDYAEPNYKQPLFLFRRKIVSYQDFITELKKMKRIRIRLLEVDDKIFQWKAAEKLYSMIGLNVDEERVYPLITFSGKMKPDDSIDEDLRSGEGRVYTFIKNIHEVLGKGCRINKEFMEVEGYRHSYIDITIDTPFDE